MKKLFLLFCISFVATQISAQKNDIKKDRRPKGDLPPGTVWLKDSLCIDQTEVRNLDYLEFVLWIKKHDPAHLAAVMPDSTVWQKHYPAYTGYYFQHPAYREYPVVGISYDQALAFCKWRTERVKDFIALSKQTIQQRMGVRDFYYRLPTKEEWEYAAAGGLSDSYLYGHESIISKNKAPNVYVAETKALMAATAEEAILVPVKYQSANGYKLYNTIGNVAEMVSEKGIAKGGSYYHTLVEAAIAKSLAYEKPSAFIGFRCVCILVK